MLTSEATMAYFDPCKDHQIPLAAKSRYITTFATHKGLRRYTRLNFGTNSASEIFQHMISEQLRDITGAFNISDDVIVYGKTQADHDKALRAVFQKFADIHLTLNKCEFNKSSLSFFGFVFSKEGISPDPDKVRAIHNMSPPKSVPEVRSFLGMATYCAKFIPSFSDVSQPLSQLSLGSTCEYVYNLKVSSQYLVPPVCSTNITIS